MYIYVCVYMYNTINECEKSNLGFTHKWEQPIICVHKTDDIVCISPYQ